MEIADKYLIQQNIKSFENFVRKARKLKDLKKRGFAKNFVVLQIFFKSPKLVEMGRKRLETTNLVSFQAQKGVLSGGKVTKLIFHPSFECPFEYEGAGFWKNGMK